jgi:hypothetical protein
MGCWGMEIIKTNADPNIIISGWEQQNLISAIAEICVSPMQEVQALRILIYRGEAACRQYLRLVLVKRKKAF